MAASRAPPQFVLLGQAVGGQAQLHALLAHPRLRHQLLGRGLPVRLVEPALGVARGHPAHGLFVRVIEVAVGAVNKATAVTTASDNIPATSPRPAGAAPWVQVGTVCRCCFSCVGRAISNTQVNLGSLGCLAFRNAWAAGKLLCKQPLTAGQALLPSGCLP